MRGSNAAELSADIEERISIGSLKSGDRLPPVRVLATELGLAPNTVAASYRRLGERGIVVGRGRSGTFVAPRPPVAAPADLAVPEGIWDLSNGNPDATLLPDLSDAIKGLGGRAVLYGGAPIDESLAVAAAEWLKGDQIPVEHLAVVSGALDGIERVLEAHLRPGDRVAVEDPAYASVIDLLGAMGFIPVPVAVDDEGPVPNQLADGLERGALAFVVTPRAQNPFGSALSEGRARAIREVLVDHPQVLVVEDDHASEVAGAPFHAIGHGRDRWAMVRSVAKTYGPDLRLAVVAGDAATIRRVEGRQGLGPGWVSHILQRLSASLLADPKAGSIVRSAADEYRRRREAVAAPLRSAGFEVHGASGLNLWIPVRDEVAAVGGLRDRGMAVRAGARYRIRSAPGIRLTVASVAAAQSIDVVAALLEVLRPNSANTRSG